MPELRVCPPWRACPPSPTLPPPPPAASPGEARPRMESMLRSLKPPGQSPASVSVMVKVSGSVAALSCFGSEKQRKIRIETNIKGHTCYIYLEVLIIVDNEQDAILHLLSSSAYHVEDLRHAYF
ncbi:hypothetical protein HJG60_011669 [Phyllostomus discolor]|uniref:Uncharacterized protein n=1 Tax=Phyllostomus discolor TaxID=89673 RepID=A0A833ZVU4_9CHIR|nr:hypothetical protein HJG60_011669 [Phyllostomus discolor]